MYICYSFFLVVSFPGFSFPKSIFEKDHCLYADHKEESDLITQIKRNCIHEVKNHQEKSPFVLSRRSRPSRIHYQEERITREDGVEMVIMKSHKEEENKRNELPLLDSTGVFSDPPSPSKQQESLPSLSQHESSISEQNTVSTNQNTTFSTNQNVSNNNTTSSTNQNTSNSNTTSSTNQNISNSNTTSTNEQNTSNNTSNTSTSTNQIDSTIPPPASLQISHSSMNAASSPILTSLDRMHDSSSSSHNLSSINTPDHLSGFSITQVHSDHPSGFSIKPSPSIPSPKKNMEDVQIIDYVFCVSSFTVILLTGQYREYLLSINNNS